MSACCLGKCRRPVKYSILLAGDLSHVYLPNQFNRDQGREHGFCHPCMRVLEASLRAGLALLLSGSAEAERLRRWIELSDKTEADDHCPKKETSP